MGPRSSFGRPLEVLKSRPKAFYEGNQVRAGPTGAEKCVSGAGKVFSGRNGEYLGSVGPLWWHMVEVEKIEILEIFGAPGGSLNGPQEQFWLSVGDFGIPPRGISRWESGSSRSKRR